MTKISGFINVHKPGAMTSHDVVAKVRRWLKQHGDNAKVGHAGTLDPLATGVLIICIGNATRLSDYVMHGTKRYRAVVRFGATTDTYDAEGAILQTRDTTHLTLDAVTAVLPQFTGAIQQVPPMYSAIKQDGKKLYELARAGQEVERPPRAVTIHAIHVIDANLPDVTLDVVCSAGTYIRSLAYDLGEVLGVGAHLAALTRTASGTFALEDATTLDALEAAPDLAPYLIAPRAALRDHPIIELTPDEVRELRFGRSIPRSDQPSAATAMAFLGDDLIAILEAREKHWKPNKVFNE
jgi:tRNA pseudouridine55 synthase